MAATATCPSVNTYPGTGTCSLSLSHTHAHTRTHTHTHRCPQSLIRTKIHVSARTGSETHTTTHTHINTKEYLDIQTLDALRNTLRYTCSHLSPSASGSFPASCWDTESGWALQVGKESHLAQNWAFCLLCFPTRKKPPGSAIPLGQRSWAYVKESACPRTLG